MGYPHAAFFADSYFELARTMKSRPIDECLAASSQIVATTRERLTRLYLSVDTCLTRIEISADAIAASQALLAKLDGKRAALAGSISDIEPAASEQTSDGAASGLRAR